MANNFCINQKLENPAMRELLARRKSVDSSDANAVNEVMSALIGEIVMKADFLSVVEFSNKPVPDENGQLVLKERTDINFTLLNNSNGEHFFPLFTESSELEKWENIKIGYTIQVGFDMIAKMIMTNKNCGGLVINPFSDNMTVSKDIVSKWLEKKQLMTQGHAQRILSPDSKYEFHTLNPYPMLLSNKLCETAKNLPISGLWLRGIELDGSDGYLLAVEFTGDRMETFSALGNAVKPLLSGKALHIIDSKEHFGQIAIDKTMPIYKKD